MLCAEVGITLERLIRGKNKSTSKSQMFDYVKDDTNPDH